MPRQFPQQNRQGESKNSIGNKPAYKHFKVEKNKSWKKFHKNIQQNMTQSSQKVNRLELESMIFDSIRKAKSENLQKVPYNYNLDSFHFSTVSGQPVPRQPVSRQPEKRFPETTPQGRCQPTVQRPEQEKLAASPQVNMDPFSLSNTLEINDTEFHAGSLKQKIPVWRKITSDPQILKLLGGASLQFEDRPTQDRLPHEIQFTGNFKNLVQKELDKFLTQGIIEHTQFKTGDFISNLFARPKKTPGEIRLILNLKKLNVFVPTIHFKMESLDIALKMLRPDMYMASIDLTNSFYHLLVKPRFRKFLKFSCLGQSYQFTSLPMGFKHSPYLFTKLMKTPLAFLREHYGCILVCYIDDILVLGNTKQEVCNSVAYTVNLLQMLGFHINAAKSEFEPTRVIEFLGFFLNSSNMTVSLTQDKIEKIQTLADQVLEQHTFSIRFLAQFIGNCVAAFPAVEFGPYHTKELEIEKALALKNQNMNFEASMSLSEWAILHVEWWKNHVSQAINSLVVPPNRDQIHLFCDASTVGWGAYFPSTRSQTGGLWDLQEQSLHINVLELKSIYLSILIYFDKLHSSTVHIHTDNQVALFSLKRQGSTQSPWCNKFTAKIMNFLENRNLHLIVSYIRSENNTEADQASRVYQHDLEWSIPDDQFEKICQKWGSPEIDLFASRLNHRVPKYCSWRPDPHAYAVDAFGIDWDEFNLIYAFPPIRLLPRVLKTWQDITEARQRGHKEKHAIIVAPLWPAQPWFPVLQKLTREKPLKLHSSQLILHHRPQEKHRLDFKLLVCKL